VPDVRILCGGELPDNFGYDFCMMMDSAVNEFPHPFPVFLSRVLQILADGHAHEVEEIRERIAREFALTPEQLLLRRRDAFPTIFVNKVALAFNRLVFHNAIEAGSGTSGSYRITAHGLDILKRCPTDARERDL
jgi:restriction endonuclease Mrr